MASRPPSVTRSLIRFLLKSLHSDRKHRPNNSSNDVYQHRNHNTDGEKRDGEEEKQEEEEEEEGTEDLKKKERKKERKKKERKKE